MFDSRHSVGTEVPETSGVLLGELIATGMPEHVIVGGRAIHPINVRVGGFWHAPARRELRPLAPLLQADAAALLTAAGFSRVEVAARGRRGFLVTAA